MALMIAAGALIPNQNSTALAQTAEHPVFFPTTIELPKLVGVSKYRLQIADDEDFRNVLFDVRLVGGPHNVCWLSPGSYYWRVAPSNGKTGAFLTPVKFFVSGGVGTSFRRRRLQDVPSPLSGISASRVRSRGLKHVGG
jgi:hypothetical protein